MKQFTLRLTTITILVAATASSSVATPAPIAAPDLVFGGTGGTVAVESEHFYKQTLSDKRAWHITSSKHTPDLKPDSDGSHVGGASGGAYVESLPDTRTNHDEKLIKGENFTDEAGLMAVLHYKVNISTPGRYYVWVRAFSSDSEDNGVHVGLNGQWPESGQRWQTVKKHDWAWECKQRTPEVHTGVPMQLFLDIEKAGENEIMFSMREDGFEMDKFILASDKEYKPEGKGPAVKAKTGKLPAPFPDVAAAAPVAKRFPEHWGEPPAIQTRDLRPLPGGYGRGSGTLAKWIQQNLDNDAGKEKPGAAPLMMPRQADGKGGAVVTGELKQWHKVTLTQDGPYAHERDSLPNPFTDLAFSVQFTHESGTPSYKIPGYFAGDGNAGESGAESGTKWRAHLSPDKSGTWTYTVSFASGKNAALEGGGKPLAPFDGVTGSFKIVETDKKGRDFRSEGRLQYVGKPYLQFAGSKRFFLKAGPDSPETLLADSHFDNTSTGKPDKVPLKTWEPHAGDWKQGDPTFRNGKGKGLIGALNYLAGKGVNAFSFLTYNVSGDGDNIWPFVDRDAKLHYDCSKLDQWGIVFDHATALGLYLHFKLQENEMDDTRLGAGRKDGKVPAALDGGKLGIERKLYCREIMARFGHALALNWNIGEENTQSSDEIRDMVKFLHDTDPYQHNIVLHTFPPQQDDVYRPLLGSKSLLTGVSLQNSWSQVHQRTLQWLRESTAAGRPWVVANDEQNPAGLGVPPDPGYQGHDGIALEKESKGSKDEGDFKSKPYTMHDIRKNTLWGNLMAGGAGVEYYFGYQLPQNDLLAQDFRSRDKSWDYCRIALNFFRDEKIPFAEMTSSNALIGNEKDNNDKYCFAKPGELYLVYLPNGGTTDLDTSGAQGTLTVKWFNPRDGGDLISGAVKSVEGGKLAGLGDPPSEKGEDWLIVVRK
jgi:hypothetical protein